MLNPEAQLFAANEAAVCGYMKMITPAKLVRGLETGQDEIEVPPGGVRQGPNRDRSHDRDCLAVCRRGNQTGYCSGQGHYTGDRH
jgi:hypothetical protein